MGPALMPRGSKTTEPATRVKAAQRRRPKWAMSPGAAPETGESPYSLRAVSRALDAFDDEHAVMNLKDLSQVVGLSDSSLFRLLVTLHGRGYLQQNEDGFYQLARKMLLGKLSERAERFREKARPELQKLSSHLNETASLAYLFVARIQVIESIDSLHDIRVSNRPGRVLPPHCSAMGKIITAFQDDETVGRMLECYGLTPRTEHSISNRRGFIEHLVQVRKTGLAFDREESTVGGICMAAAVRQNGRVTAAISVSTPVARMTPKHEKETAAEVLRIAGVIGTLV